MFDKYVHHGPIKVIASGDDILPDEGEFDYFSEQLPAIVKRELNTESHTRHEVR